MNSINEEILENVSGGIPIGRDGKPLTPSEYKKRKEDDGIHVTSGTFTVGPEYTSTDMDGIHVTSATF